ncbi:hypothetical protein GCM10010339_75310 [Streptomyces alanosinicus]|uniref:Uncharacterized protein n=1 Tax=Streptomyces alanosinicus TaxID=68171 RepID=A0A918YR48_9ACTN|nr:hypothetical protein GCM10010339_75310 [Streptomyces alanosinicus]
MDGLRPALVTGSAVVALAAVAALVIPGRRSAAGVGAGEEQALGQVLETGTSEAASLEPSVR